MDAEGMGSARAPTAKRAVATTRKVCIVKDRFGIEVKSELFVLNRAKECGGR